VVDSFEKRVTNRYGGKFVQWTIRTVDHPCWSIRRVDNPQVGKTTMNQNTNATVLKMWLGIVKTNLENHKIGSYQGFKMVPCTKSRLFEVPLTFLALKMTLAVARAKNRAKKVSGTSKSLDDVPGPFIILEMAPFSDFQGLFSQCQATFSAQLH